MRQHWQQGYYYLGWIYLTSSNISSFNIFFWKTIDFIVFVFFHSQNIIKISNFYLSCHLRWGCLKYRFRWRFWFYIWLSCWWNLGQCLGLIHCRLNSRQSVSWRFHRFWGTANLSLRCVIFDTIFFNFTIWFKKRMNYFY